MSGAAKFAQFKLVLLGESAVGKSSLVTKFGKGTFAANRESTIGAAFVAQSVFLEERNTTVRFEIWDTAGQERYKSLAPMYYRNANAAIVVFDLTSQPSLTRAKAWVRELRVRTEGVLVVLCGNKVDEASKREVSQETAQAYADEEDLLYFETSAKTGDNVNAMFRAIAERMPIDEYLRAREAEEQHAIDLSRQPRQGASCGC